MSVSISNRSTSILTTLGLLSALTACTSNGLDDSKNSNGESTTGTPFAEAGSGGTFTADQPIRLNGDGSYDPDGDELTYQWSFSRVPSNSGLMEASGVFSQNNSAETETVFFADTSGTYIVDLVVTDSTGLESTPDSVVVLVEEGQLPIAEAGIDVDLEEGETTTLDASQSADPLCRTLNYAWDVVSKPALSSLTGVDVPTAQTSPFTPDVAGRYLVSLIVNNGVSDSLPDTITVDVFSADPLPPVSDAGGDLLQESDCTAIQLSGLNSMDPNGDPLEYLWAIQSKPTTSTATNASFSDTTAVSPTFYADVAGDYVVSLAVYDGSAWSIPDLITVTAGERVANALPFVEAGSAIAVDAGNAECELSGYSYNCGDCSNMTVQLGSDASVSDADGDPLTYSWYVMSGDATLSDETDLNTEVVLSGATTTEPNVCETTTYEFELVAQDCPGGAAADSLTITMNCCGIEIQ